MSYFVKTITEASDGKLAVLGLAELFYQRWAVQEHIVLVRDANVHKLSPYPGPGPCRCVARCCHLCGVALWSLSTQDARFGSGQPQIPPAQGRPRTLAGADPGLGASFKMQMPRCCLAAPAVTGCEFVPANSILQYF